MMIMLCGVEENTMIGWIIKKIFSFFRNSEKKSDIETNETGYISSYTDEGKDKTKKGALVEYSETLSNSNDETNQQTLYSNPFGFISTLCPCCDGENVSDSGKCNICGKELR